MEDKLLNKRFDEVLRISTKLITAVNGIRDNVATLQNDMTELHEEVKEVKIVQASHSHRLEHMESDASTLKHDVKFIKREYRNLQRANCRCSN